MKMIQCPYYQLTLDNPKGTHDELISAFAEFQKGNQEVSQAYQIEQFLIEEELIAYEDFSFENLDWEHSNIWGFPY